MKSGYKVLWSEQALTDLQNILDYLSENWTQRELKNFSQHLDKRINLIRHYPNIFPSSSTKKSNKTICSHKAYNHLLSSTNTNTKNSNSFRYETKS